MNLEEMSKILMNNLTGNQEEDSLRRLGFLTEYSLLTVQLFDAYQNYRKFDLICHGLMFLPGKTTGKKTDYDIAFENAPNTRFPFKLNPGMNLEYKLIEPPKEQLQNLIDGKTRVISFTNSAIITPETFDELYDVLGLEFIKKLSKINQNERATSYFLRMPRKTMQYRFKQKEQLQAQYTLSIIEQFSEDILCKPF